MEPSAEDLSVHLLVHRVLMGLGCVVWIIILILNILPTIVFAKVASLQRLITNHFILNLCATDVGFGLSLLTYSVVRMQHPDPGSMSPAVRSLLRTCILFCHISMMVTVHTVNCIGIERTVALFLPHKYRQLMTTRKAVALIAMFWIFNGVVMTGLALPYFLTTQQFVPQMICGCYSRKVYDSFIRPQAYAVIGITFVIYVVISIKVKQHKEKWMGKMESWSQKALRMREARRVTKMTTAIGGSMILTWAPYCVVSILTPHEPYAATREYCFINVLVYGWFNWKAFRRVLLSWKVQPLRSVESSSIDRSLHIQTRVMSSNT